MFVADSQSSTLNVYQRGRRPQQPVATTPYTALYYYTLEPTVSLTATTSGGQPPNINVFYGGQSLTYTWTSMGVPYGNVTGSANLDASPCTLTDNNTPPLAAPVAPAGSQVLTVPGVYDYTVGISCHYVSADGNTTTPLTPISSVSVDFGG